MCNCQDFCRSLIRVFLVVALAVGGPPVQGAEVTLAQAVLALEASLAANPVAKAAGANATMRYAEGLVASALARASVPVSQHLPTSATSSPSL